MKNKNKTYNEIKSVSNDEVIESNINIKSEDDNVVDKVKTLRDKGYNNNQIASMLNMHKQTIDKI
jgi:hypothetical protein